MFHSQRRVFGRRTALAAAMGVPALLGCVPAIDRSGGDARRVLYVANGKAGTVSRLDAATGRPVGAPVPAGPAPWCLVSEPGGALLVLSLVPGRGASLTHVVPGGVEPRLRSVQLTEAEPAEPFGTSIASDGERHTVAAFRVQPETPSTLALLETRSGSVVRTVSVGVPAEKVVGLALDDGPGGPVAYVGLWAEGSAGDFRTQAGRVLAVDLRTGAVLASRHVPGVPGQLLLCPSPLGMGRQVCAVVSAPTDEDGRTFPGMEPTWRLQTLDPLTLDGTGTLLLEEPISWVAVAQDGVTAYGVSGATLPGRTVLRFHLETGAIRELARLPHTGLGLAVAGDRLYVPAPDRDMVLVLDRHTGAPLPSAPVGASPISITGPVAA